jgi:GNAT superfamily N-acetyltransferase
MELLEAFLNNSSWKNPIELESYGSKTNLKFLEMFEREFSSDLSVLLGVLKEGKLIGISYLDLHDYVRGWLHYLIVLQEYRRQGVGTALLKRSEEIIKEFGKHIFRLTALKLTQIGRHFAEKNNYQLIRNNTSVIFEKRIE